MENECKTIFPIANEKKGKDFQIRAFVRSRCVPLTLRLFVRRFDFFTQFNHLGPLMTISNHQHHRGPLETIRYHEINMTWGNTRKIPDQDLHYPIIPDWLNIWWKYPYPIHTRSVPKYFFQYPNPIRPEVENPYPLGPAPPAPLALFWVIFFFILF